MKKHTISFVVLTWNSRTYIRKCIKSILVDMAGTPFDPEIYIVDNGSTDGTPVILKALDRRYQGQVFPIFLEKNYGTTVSRNLALKRVQGEYICILDSDIEILPGLFMESIQTLSSNDDIGLVAPQLIYPGGRIQKSHDQFPTIYRKIFRYFFLKKMEEQAPNLLDKKVQSVEYAISALWVMKKRTLERVGMLDEAIFYAPEDADYCLRIWKSGRKVVYNPRATAVHHTQEISRGFKPNKAMWDHIQGLFYFFCKHHIWFSRPRPHDAQSS